MVTVAGQVVRRVLALANALFSFSVPTSMLILFSLAGSIFGGIWTISEAAGVQGSPGVLVLIISLSLLLTALIGSARIFKWNLIIWSLRHSLRPLLNFDPTLVIGLGFGGGILAGIIGKLLSEKTGREPAYCVIDRTFLQDQKLIQVRVGTIDVSHLRSHSKILLVTGEVHTGNTLNSASQYLDSLGLPHRTFTYIISTSSFFRVDFFVFRSESRGILPWEQAPVRRDIDAGGG